MVRLENVRKTEESRGEPRTRTLHDSTNILGPRKSKRSSFPVIFHPEKNIFGGDFLKILKIINFRGGGGISKNIENFADFFVKIFET